MNERELIARFVRGFDRAGPGLRLGPGDDAALLRPTKGKSIVATTDAVLEGVHFGPRFTPEDIGHKALAVNLSDLAAMGARPRWFLVALELPAEPSLQALVGVARGMASLARKHRCLLAGGNLASGTKLGVTITAIGEVDERRALRRDRLSPGDAIAVTGRLGAAALGLQRLRAGSRHQASAQLRPEPRVAAGLAAIGIAHAAIDVSDGFALDLGRMAQASSVHVELTSADLPVAKGASVQQALYGGEDYELVFGLRRLRFPALKRKLTTLGVPIRLVGEARRGRGVTLDGVELRPGGYDHFGQGRSFRN